MRYLTQAIAGAGGRFKAQAEDFEVEELPAYHPGGEGEHLFVWIEKRGVATPEAAKRLAHALGVPDAPVSWAGLKDAHAVTRQYLCLPAKGAEGALASASVEGVKLLRWARHGNKLKNGHLHGNRFRLVLREVKDAAAAKASFEVLCARGLPNFYGEQRFGGHGDNAEKGRALLLGKLKAKHFERKLWLSAFQSSLFNRVLDARLDDQTWDVPQLGDVLKKHESGGEFVCADPAVDAPRARAFELSPTGPMYGPSMRAPEGTVAALEARVLADAEVTLADFEKGGAQTQGTRRLLRVPLGEPTFEAQGSEVRLSFTLPAGSYATVVLGELIKG